MDEDRAATNLAAGPADGILSGLVTDLAKAGMSLPVTLAVGGNLIYGSVVTVQEYLEGIATTFENAVTTEQTGKNAALGLAKGIRDGIEHGIKAQTSAGEPTEAKPELRYIHLKDAQIWFPETTIGGPGSYWRIRLEAVDGFAFGWPTGG